MRLLLGTNNPGKQAEISALLKTIQIEILTPANVELHLDVKEDGETYMENASLKARAFAKESGLWVLADDSGLEVDILNGAPGLFSARYSPEPGAGDRDRRLYLLQTLKEFPQPWKARFTCTAVLSSPDGETYHSVGICEGEIIPEEKGTGGFGYDPIFLIPQKQETMAQLSLEEKNQLSHRARAVAGMIPILLQIQENKSSLKGF
jgi:XTP/dITP diphosphohydrolase